VSTARYELNLRVMYITLQSPVVTICTTRFNTKKFYVLSTRCVLCGSENKQKLHCSDINFRPEIILVDLPLEIDSKILKWKTPNGKCKRQKSDLGDTNWRM